MYYIVYYIVDFDLFNRKRHTHTHITSHNEVSVCRSQLADIKQQGRHRQEKIARFRHRKQLEESLKELRLQATKDHADDEITVGNYTTVIIVTLCNSEDNSCKIMHAFMLQ